LAGPIAVQSRWKGLDVLLVISAAASVVFLIASYHDIRRRSIPNWLPISVAVAAVLKWSVSGQLSPALWAAGAAAIVLIVSAILFAQGWVGGGDVKLAAAAAFFLGAPATPQFLVLMSVIGGGIAVLMLLGWSRERQRPTIPYGVAIAGAAIAMMALDWRTLWVA
jgi:prepilin peptidase CpaA